MEKTEIKVNDFNAIRLSLASPADILSWSKGEITKAETLNYRTQKPEREGLFSEQVFGPIKDYECACGKYKRMRYKEVICDKCGVEITRSLVRRERMGHIELACPVAHIWFLSSIPSRVGTILDIPLSLLEKVIYYNSYIITSVDEEAKARIIKELEHEYQDKLKKSDSEDRGNLAESRMKAYQEIAMLKLKTVLSELEYYHFSRKYGDVFEAGIGAEPIKKMLSEIDLKKKQEELKLSLKKTATASQKKLLLQLKLINGLIKSGIRPEWMFLTVLPVLPPELRPMVQLDGGRYASSDLNDLYRRVINRNNRLKRLIELKAPEVILKNEKRMLQEAVDALLDNSIRKSSRSTPMQAAQHRPLRSLADALKGKEGRFRQNLLGKRVDYSGRSVIVVGSELKIHECGLPKTMALELFKPFIIKELLKREVVFNPKSASRLIDEGIDIVWEILEEVVKDKYVLLNRAPTLHRLGIQAFKPTLIEGLAIQIPALVCAPFNADFDGDNMACHLPLSTESQTEAENRILSKNGLLKPSSGEISMFLRHDMVLGIYWLMILKDNTEEKNIKVFSSEEEALYVFEIGEVSLQEKIKVRIQKNNNQLEETSVGRIIFNKILPEDWPFINNILKSSDLKKLTSQIINKYDFSQSSEILDKLKEVGFYYSTRSGISLSMNDLKVPLEKKDILNKTEKEVELVYDQYSEGLLTEEEKYLLVVSKWEHATSQIGELVSKMFAKDEAVYCMFDSGARGSWGAAIQMMGIKGLVVSPTGKTIELPIISSFQEGFNVLEYFTASHGGRKGLADTALKTSAAGYLTQRLVTVAQDLVITEEDCQTEKGFEIIAQEVEKAGEKMSDKIWGRFLAEDITKDNKIIAKKGDFIDKELALSFEKDKIEKIVIRSPLTCECYYGLCQKCYGQDLGWKKIIDLGEAVGIIAAQAISEPGTQLTLKTKLTGGVARAADITQGLPRVNEIFEASSPKKEAIISEIDGEVEEIRNEEGSKIIKIQVIAEKNQSKTKNKTKKDKDNVSVKEYFVSENHDLWVKKGDIISKGQQLTSGNLNLKQYLKLAGEEACQKYILQEVKKVYNIAGEIIHDKHLEVIIRQMFSRVKITDSGDSNFIPGEIIEKRVFLTAKDELKNKKLPEAIPLVLGIKNVALTCESFLSAASFQETSRVLIKAALNGQVDYLRGLKENVIIGRLIPAGTGFKKKFDNDIKS